VHLSYNDMRVFSPRASCKSSCIFEHFQLFQYSQFKILIYQLQWDNFTVWRTEAEFAAMGRHICRDSMTASSVKLMFRRFRCPNTWCDHVRSVTMMPAATFNVSILMLLTPLAEVTKQHTHSLIKTLKLKKMFLTLLRGYIGSTKLVTGTSS